MAKQTRVVRAMLAGESPRCEKMEDGAVASGRPRMDEERVGRRVEDEPADVGDTRLVRTDPLFSGSPDTTVADMTDAESPLPLVVLSMIIEPRDDDERLSPSGMEDDEDALAAALVAGAVAEAGEVDDLQGKESQYCTTR